MSWLVVAVVAVLWPGPGRAAVLPPEAGTLAPALASPHRPGDEVAPGVRVRSFSTGGDTIAITVASETERARLVLRLDPGGAGPGRRSRSFAISFEPDPPPAGLVPALEELARCVERNDDGTLAGAARPALTSDATGATPLSLGRTALAIGLWLALLAAIVFGTARSLRRGTRPRAIDMAWTAAVVLGPAVLSAVLRAAAPVTLLHHNIHGIEDLRAAVAFPIADPRPAFWIRDYWASALVAQRAIAAVLGGLDTGVLAGAVAWGALATAGASVSVLALARSRRAALLAGLLHATWPLAARVAHSESQLVVVQAVAAFVPAAVAWAATRPGAWRLATAAALVAIVSTGHAIGPVLGLGLVAASAPLAAGLPWTRRTWLVAAGLAAIPLAAGASVLAASPDLLSHQLELGRPGPRSLADGLFFSGAWTPVPLAALAVAGLAVARGARNGLAWGVADLALRLAGAWAFLAATMSLHGVPAIDLRYQALATPLLATLAGASPAWAAARCGAARRGPAVIAWAVAAVLALAAAGMGAASREAWTWRDIEAQAYEVAVEAAASLPDGAVVRVPYEDFDVPDRVQFDFPEFAGLRGGRHLSVAGQDPSAGPGAPGLSYAWRGPACGSSRHADLRDLLPPGGSRGVRERASCRAFFDALVTEPVVERWFAMEPPPDPDQQPAIHHYPEGPVLVGLYRVRGPGPGASR